MVDIIPNYDLPDIHCLMLADKHRLDSYSSAIQKHVKTGDIVIDYGAGTGILSLMAARAGAKKVYAIDNGRNTEIMKKIIIKNSLEGRIEIICEEGAKAVIPKKADVLISEWMGVWALQDNMLPGLIYLRDNFLKENAKILPSRVSLYIVPSSQKNNFPDFSNIHGFDLSEYNSMVCSQPFVALADTNDFLSEPKKLKDIDISSCTLVPSNFMAEYEAEKDGIINSFFGWFTACFYETVCLDTSPLTKTHWRQAQFSMEKPIQVKKGNLIRVSVEALNSSYDNRKIDFKISAGVVR